MSKRAKEWRVYAKDDYSEIGIYEVNTEGKQGAKIADVARMEDAFLIIGMYNALERKSP